MKTEQILDKTGYEKVEIQVDLWYNKLSTVKVCNNPVGLTGKNIAFTCGLALQQGFDWLVGLSKERVLKRASNVEIVFEEQDFDGFLNKLKEYPNIEFHILKQQHSYQPFYLQLLYGKKMGNRYAITINEKGLNPPSEMGEPGKACCCLEKKNLLR